MPLAPNQRPRVQKPIIQDKLFYKYFVYSVDFPSGVNAGTTSQQSLKIQADSDFEWIKSTVTAYIDSTGTSGTVSFDDWLMGVRYPGYTCIITEDATQTQLMDIATPVCAIFGTAQQPFVLPNPKIINANSSFTIQVSNIYTTNNLGAFTLSFIGRKIYRGTP